MWAFAIAHIYAHIYTQFNKIIEHAVCQNLFGFCGYGLQIQTEICFKKHSAHPWKTLHASLN